MNYSKASASNSDLEAAQAFLFSRDDLFLGLIISAEGDDVYTLLRAVSTEVSDDFFDSANSLAQRVVEVFDQIKQKLSSTEQSSISVAAWQGQEVLYLVSTDQRAYLKRAQLIPLDSQGQLISGYLKEGDRLLVLTHSLNSLSKTEELINTTLDNFEDTVTSLLIEAQERAPAAALLVDFSPEMVNLDGTLSEGPSPVGSLINKLKQWVKERDGFWKSLVVGLSILALVGLVSWKHRSVAPIPVATTSPSASPDFAITQISSWPLFLDLGLIKSSFSTTRLSYSAGHLLLLDLKQKTLVEIGLTNKSNQILAGQTQLGQASLASLNGDMAYVYSDKGVVKVDTNSTKASVVIPKDPDWGEISDLYAFAGNIYLLDNTKNQIWKYVAGKNGYSPKLPYLKSGVKADFGGGKKMEIDSSVWVLKSGSEIDRFTAGVEDNFSPGGLDKPLKDITNFFISSETDNIYLVDRANSRLVVMDKSGKYISQYIGDKFKSLSDLVVDEANKKVYLLDSGKIYVIDLK